MGITAKTKALTEVKRWRKLSREVGWSVKGLASACGVSTRTLERFWKVHQKKCLRSWLREQRFRYARALLISTDSTISEVAGAVAYTHISGFTHAFRAKYGLSPKKWRNTRLPTHKGCTNDKKLRSAIRTTEHGLSHFSKLSRLHSR